MIWKTLIVAFMATAVLAQEIDLSDQRREQYRNMLAAQCRKMGAEDKVKDVESSVRNFVECLRGIVDPQAIKKEIEEAKPKGELDEVFKKYCAKAPVLKTCISSLLDGVRPCVDKVAIDHYGPLLNTTNQLIDFVCYKDGERIALFIAHGGSECFKNSTEDLKKCAEEMKNSFPSVEAAKAMSLPDKCGKFDDLTTCMVTSLEKCENPTPANMAESLLKFIRKDSPCNAAVPKD
ncbi:27 kDa hemolymph glycoprotein [Manduca sexta]|uniref:27 kDa hemolymph glycoprotein n=1 Tax=Manduca sexta TaxID=7130 RepID=HGLY_MANSE|nr:27 kDa hemolymph glycoprotein [Manduca sexta]Q25513.1 RecName: Full=27 kDa hemolymph glycoprotein; Flags: Precursor [Manduca sexta]AAA74052.1 glycoprotein [Manduca sexta]